MTKKATDKLNSLTESPTGALLDYNERLQALAEDMAAIHAAVSADERDFSADESNQLDSLQRDFDRLIADKERVEGIAARAEKVAAAYRRTEGEDPANSLPQSSIRVPAKPRDAAAASRHGFHSIGEFARAVMRGSRESAVVDPRLHFRAGPSVTVNEGSGTEGGFLIPPDFRNQLVELLEGEDSLLGRTDQQQCNSNTWVAPANEESVWSTGGIQAHWDGEGDQLQQSRPNFQQLSLRLHRLTALVPVSDEMSEDAGALERFLLSRAPAVINFKINEAIIRGTGAGQPLGILNSPALVTVAKETSQAADTIRAANVMSMWARLYSPYRNRAAWLINQDLESQMPLMGSLITTPDGTTAVGGAGLVYMPPGGLSGAQYGTLMGRPVIPCESCSGIGDVGDIILAALPHYLTVKKAGGLTKTDMSMHLWFDFATMAFRFITRLAGQPWLSAPIARAHSSLTLSSFVTLAAR